MRGSGKVIPVSCGCVFDEKTGAQVKVGKKCRPGEADAARLYRLRHSLNREQAVDLEHVLRSRRRGK